MTLKPQIYKEDIKAKMCGDQVRFYGKNLYEQSNLGSLSFSLVCREEDDERNFSGAIQKVWYESLAAEMQLQV